MDSRQFLRGEAASACQLKSFLPFSLPQKDLTSRAIVTEVKFVQRRANASPVSALHDELHSECTTEARPNSSLSSMLPPNLSSERGVFFSTGPSFFRPQSSLGRDLAVLAAALYKRSQGRLRVLDVMSGCGVRALRYLAQSEADFVVANDCNKDLHSTMVENLSRYAPLQGLHLPPEPVSPLLASHNCKEIFWSEGPSSGVGNSNSQDLESHSSTGIPISQGIYLSVDEGSFGSRGSPATLKPPNFSCTGTQKPNMAGEAEDNHCEHDILPATDSASSNNSCFRGPLPSANAQQDFERGRSSSCIKWHVCHEEAARLLTRCNLDMDFYDFIDVDSFGSDSFIGPALSALRFGGLLYITSTDGFSSGGHRPYNSLAQYGTFIKPMPYSNELGLRMLTGAAIKEGALRNMIVSPIFSIYAPHGPVFRVLLRASPGKLNKNMPYRFIYYCGKCGDSSEVDWESLGTTHCPCSEKVSDSIKMSGPLWTGPLHNAKDIQDMTALAKEWGWIADLPEAESLRCSRGDRRKKKQEKLLEILNLMLEESHPELHFGFKHLDEIAKRGKIQAPRREKFIQALRNEGYIASRSHVCANSVKTNCSMASCIAVAKRLAETGY